MRRQSGFSLAEMMISMAIGLVILAGMATLFVNNSRAADEVEKANRQLESGRFALQTLAIDARNAGYYAEFDPSSIADPAMPDACSVAPASIEAALPLYVQGINNYNTGSPAVTLSCLSDVKTGTDVLVIRRVQTCELGTGNCAPASDGGLFFQASMCNNSSEMLSGTITDHYDMGITTGALTRHKRDCTTVGGTGTLSAMHRFVTHIYYIANNGEEGDRIPTLKRRELGGTTLGFTTVALTEGIENLQIEYGLDVDNDTNSSPDSFTSLPATVADWRDVVALKVSLLARNVNTTNNFTDVKTYTLAGGTTVGPMNDRYKRHVFASMVSLPNPSGRKMPQ